MKLYNNTPNFNIVLPGGCNARCAFCFNTATLAKPQKGAYVKNLIDTLQALPEEFKQISITGGEPTLSPMFETVLGILAGFKKKFQKVVLTTNGTNLEDFIADMSEVVDHVNISRHHHKDDRNIKIFSGSYCMTTKKTAFLVDELSKIGVDTSLNCVISDSTSFDFVQSMIKYSLMHGFSSLRLRKENSTNTPALVENEFQAYKVLEHSECHVCKSRLQRIKGLPVYWKTSVLEPKDVTRNTVFELIFGADAKTYVDWASKTAISIEDIKDLEYATIVQKPITVRKGVLGKHVKVRQNKRSAIPAYGYCGTTSIGGCGRSPSSGGCGSRGCSR